ncbi:MAG: hypothetical protein ACRD1B_12035 [Thermoanaerobaculia bacterium]
MERDAIEHLDIDSALYYQAFDGVKAIQFGFGMSDPGQVPAPGRWWMSDSAATVDHSSPLQDTSDGADRGNIGTTLLGQLSMDGGIAKFSQVAGVLELLPDPKDLLLGLGAQPVGRAIPRARGAIGPIDPIKPLPFGSLHPPTDSCMSDSESNGDRSDRLTLTDGGDHGAAALLSGVFLVMFPPTLSARLEEHTPSPDPTLAWAPHRLWTPAEIAPDKPPADSRSRPQARSLLLRPGRKNREPEKLTSIRPKEHPGWIAVAVS